MASPSVVEDYVAIHSRMKALADARQSIRLLAELPPEIKEFLDTLEIKPRRYAGKIWGYTGEIINVGEMEFVSIDQMTKWIGRHKDDLIFMATHKNQAAGAKAQTISQENSPNRRRESTDSRIGFRKHISL